MRYVSRSDRISLPLHIIGMLIKMRALHHHLRAGKLTDLGLLSFDINPVLLFDVFFVISVHPMVVDHQSSVKFDDDFHCLDAGAYSYDVELHELVLEREKGESFFWGSFGRGRQCDIFAPAGG